MATGDGDIAFALFHGSSHIHDHGAQENGTHTITPIGIATHTYTNEELAINSESTDAEIIAAYCVRYPTFVKSIHQ